MQRVVQNLLNGRLVGGKKSERGEREVLTSSPNTSPGGSPDAPPPAYGFGVLISNKA